MRKRRLPALLTLVLLAGTLSTADSIRTGAPAAAAPAPAPGFVDEVVLSGLDLPTDLEFAPDGSVFVAEKRGVIKRWDSLASPTPTIYADLRTEVFNNADRGLIGLAVDPGYPAKPDVYAAFVLDQAPTGPTTVPRYGTAGEDSDPCASTCPSTGRVVRLSGVSTSSSETVLVEGWCENFYSHTIDDVEVGPDGYLYVSAGDGASADFADIGGANDACGDPVGEGGALRAQDLQTTGDPVGLDGTIIRVDTTTGAGAPSNPVASSADPNARRILASGARNPIRMTFRPGTNELYIADNGWNTWEEVNRVGNVTDGLLRNFGWPCYEGNAPQDVYVAAGAPICAALTTSAVSNPVFTYNHADNVFPSSHCAPNGSSNSAIAFYAGGTYPGRFTNALFIGDYARGCITAVLAGPDGKPDFSTMEDLVVHADNPVDLEVGPGGDLFYVDVIRGAVHRIRWVGIPDAPVAVVTPATTTGSVPLHIDFNASASHDPASLALTYAWDLDGDGTFDDATGATTSWNYEYPLSTFARVRVTNSAGSSDIGSVVINATGAPSTPGRLVPSPDAPIAFGNAETSTSVARAVRFHNFGGSAVTVTGATASGPGYTVSSPALPAIVPPGGRIDLTATFSPLGVGAAAGAITLVHTGGVGPAVVSLSGTGTAFSPVATMTSPILTTNWRAGDTIAFSGTAAQRDATPLAASTMRWSVVLNHCTSPDVCHAHPLQQFSGVASGSFTAPSHEYPASLTITLTVNNTTGTATVATTILPRMTSLNIETSPAGLPIVAGSANPRATPFTTTAIENATSGVTAPAAQTYAGLRYVFDHWSDNGAASHTFAAMSGLAPLVATYRPTEDMVTVPPARVFDTRPGYAINTDATKPTAASTHTIRIAGRGGVPTTGATAVAINLTGTEADEPGYLTTWATGPRPNASNLNLTTGATAANLAIVPLAPDGTITLYTHGQTHIIIDVIGWIPAHAPEEGLGQ